MGRATGQLRATTGQVSGGQGSGLIRPPACPPAQAMAAGAMRQRTEQTPVRSASDRDSWCTPRWLAEAVGSFDLDPCSNSRSHIAARTRWSLETNDDGLSRDIAIVPSCRVFVNPPYSRDQVLRWVAKYEHARFCFLLRFDPSTEWFDRVYAASSLVCVPRRRVNFEPPPGVKASSNVYPHALFYRCEDDATPAVVRACIAWRKRPS